MKKSGKSVLNVDKRMNDPIGTFETSQTGDNIVLGNKYDNYSDAEKAIKDAHQKNQEKMFVKGLLYPTIYESPSRGFGYGQRPLKRNRFTNRMLGRRLDTGEDDTALTQKQLEEGQSNWNYKHMGLQRRNPSPNESTMETSDERKRRALEKSEEDERDRIIAKRKRKRSGGKRKTRVFKKHYMWNTKGKRYLAKTKKQHKKGKKLGHTHVKPKRKTRRRRKKKKTRRRRK